MVLLVLLNLRDIKLNIVDKITFKATIELLHQSAKST